jgi:hypothetical protein
MWITDIANSAPSASGDCFGLQGQKFLSNLGSPQPIYSMGLALTKNETLRLQNIKSVD